MTTTKERTTTTADLSPSDRFASQLDIDNEFDAIVARYGEAPDPTAMQREIAAEHQVYTDRLISGLQEHDANFVVDDDAYDTFNRAVTVALSSHEDQAEKTAALRRVVDTYRSTHLDISLEQAPTTDESTDHGTNLRQTLSLTKDLIKETYRADNEYDGRFKRVRSVMGKTATASTMLLAGVGSYAEHMQHRSEQLKAHGKRNKMKYAAGTFGVLGAGVAVGLLARRYDLAIGGMNSDTVSALDVPNLPVERQQVFGGYNFAAKSDIIVPTNGRGNQNGASLMPFARTLGHDGSEVKAINYPAGIKTPVTPGDSHTLDQSVRIASDQQYAIYKQSQGKTITYAGYSEGGVTQTVTEARIRAENDGKLPDNVRFVYIGTPTVPGGAAENPYWGAVPDSIKSSLGLTNFDNKSAGGPNVSYYKNESDFWAAGKSASPAKMADTAIGTAFGGTHGAYGRDIPSTTVRNADGSTTTTFRGGPAVVNGYRVRSGIGNALALNQKVPITREMDEAILALRGDDNGRYNMVEITDKVARLAEQQQPGSGAIVRSTLPNLVPQQLADVATEVQNNLPRVIGQITNPGKMPAPQLNLPGLGGEQPAPAAPVAPTPPAPVEQPAYTPPAPAVQPVAPVAPAPMPAPVQEFVQQQAPVISGAAEEVKKVAPQLAPQVNQLKGMFGIK